MINLHDIKPGDTVRLIDGRRGAVVKNIGDGQWIEVLCEDQNPEDEPDLVHSQDIDEHIPA